MNYPGFSTDGLKMMLDGIRNALNHDDELPQDNKLYYVREFADWRVHATAIETELDKRKATYEKIIW